MSKSGSQIFSRLQYFPYIEYVRKVKNITILIRQHIYLQNHCCIKIIIWIETRGLKNMYIDRYTGIIANIVTKERYKVLQTFQLLQFF